MATTLLSRSQYNVHPTALISACDFLARVRAEQKLGLLPQGTQLIGLVIGHPATAQRTAVELVDCCEAKYTEGSPVDGTNQGGGLGDEFVLDAEFVRNKHRMLKKVDPAGEIVGWFCFGAGLPANHARVHAQFRAATAGLQTTGVVGAAAAGGGGGGIAVVVHQIDANSVNELPVSVYSFDSAAAGAREDGVAAAAVAAPRDAAVKLAFDPAEEIAMSAISKLEPPNSSGESELVRQYRVMRGALEKLNSRVAVIQAYLKAVQSGKVPKDHALIRKISSITAQLPLVAPEAARLNLQEQQHEALLFRYLADILRSAGTLNDIVMNSNAASRGRGGGGGGDRDRLRHTLHQPTTLGVPIDLATSGGFRTVGKRGGGRL